MYQGIFSFYFFSFQALFSFLHCYYSHYLMLVIELKDYYDTGSTVVYYQHKARRKDQHYIDQHESLMKDFGLDSHYGLGLKFKTTSLRYYFFIMQPQHKEIITASICKMLSGNWKKHFEVAGSAVHLQRMLWVQTAYIMSIAYDGGSIRAE